MEGWIFLVFLIVAALAIVGGYFSYQAKQKRIAELSQFAAERGWTFTAAEDYSHDERYGHFSTFTSGRNPYAYNTITGAIAVGDAQWPVQMGDFHYETTSTSRDSNGNTSTKTHHHYLSYLLVTTPHLGTPDLFIRREGFFDKIASMLGFDDIDFESAQFSDKFIVKSSDKRFAYDVIHPRMMEFLLDAKPPIIDLQHGQCCLTLGEHCWTPQEFASTLAWAEAFFERWPRHVTTSLS
jgi:hypothetical protein